MEQTFKKLFVYFSKKIVLTFFGLAILGTLLIPQPALAGLWDWLLGAVTFIPNNIINIFFSLTLGIWSALVALAGGLLKWVLSPDFISWSYTNPATNPVIETGLNITRSFVNMGLVLILVYIAFATILRLSGYQTQKLLITLIVVALLVNFAPVICGFVVDATNIAMYYFVDNVTGMKNLTNDLVGISDSIKAGITTEEASKQFGIIFQTLVLIAFNQALFFILFLFVILFILRYVAIWVLVILAPLAFVCYILPATKRFFTLWWNQFFQWSIIGVIAGFFLYLGEQIAELMPTAEMAAHKAEYGIFDTILPHFVTLAFLIIGLIMALTTSAAGATQIVAGAKRGGKVAGKYTGKWGWRRVKGTYGGTAKAPGRMVKTYQTARTMGKSRKQAFGAAVLRPARTWKRWKPFEVKGLTKKKVKAKGGVAKVVTGVAPPWEWKITHGGSKAKAAGKGLKKAAKDSWAAAIGKKGKSKKCKKCGKTIEFTANVCPNCGHIF